MNRKDIDAEIERRASEYCKGFKGAPGLHRHSFLAGAQAALELADWWLVDLIEKVETLEAYWNSEDEKTLYARYETAVRALKRMACTGNGRVHEESCLKCATLEELEGDGGEA